ncbi:MAG: 50S ribosomal protein L4 [Caldilineae bacterium]|nr:MAG: 50S ribosomal protein L4 [Caldilineae bacterium]
MQVPVKNMAGETVGEIELSDAVFAAPVHRSLMHQALVRQLANARLGTHKTKTRSEVRGGGAKPWRQKGTGRARHGSRRSPVWVGGATVFGPRPRSYAKRMPRKMRQAALRSALTVKASSDQIVVLDELSVERPKTKEMLRALSNLGVNGQSVLVVLPEKNLAVEKSLSNLPNAKVLLSSYLNIRDLLGYDVVLMPQATVEHIHGWLGQG